jgi:hypothetical protein
MIKQELKRFLRTLDRAREPYLRVGDVLPVKVDSQTRRTLQVDGVLVRKQT